jgi:hypothetical protein
MENHLRFRRQFLLSQAPIPRLADWKSLPLNRHILYAHPDLEITPAFQNSKCITLIGHIYDTSSPLMTNSDIAEEIINRPPGIDELIAWMKRYAGRYAVFYQDHDTAAIFPDALALREIYFYTSENQVVCGSQPNLLAEFSSPEIGRSDDSRQIEFYHLHSSNSRWNPEYKWVGEDTCYQDVKHLLPHHYLDISARRAIRFWPQKPLQRRNLDEAVAKGCALLKGAIGAMVIRHPLMLAVTAGLDSRTLLAASRDYKDKIYYFINNENLGRHHPDLSVPVGIFKQIGLPLHVHEVTEKVEESFQETFFENVFFASARILSTIYNVYYQNHQDKYNVIGIGEIGRTRFGKEPRILNGYRLAYLMGYSNNDYVIEKCGEILSEMLPFYARCGLNVMTGFYWEQYLGNWGSVGNSESDIAIEEINPTNCYDFYEVLLGVDAKYAKYHHNVLFNKLIGRMWPELLTFPINPPHTTKARIKKLLISLGIFGLFKEILFRWNYRRYSRRQRKNHDA